VNARRKLLVALAASAIAATTHAQQSGKVWRIGFLAARRLGPLDSDFIGAFPRAMRDLGYVEGKNLIIEWRFVDDGNHERLVGMAAELVKLKVDIIVTGGTQATRAAQQATTAIPIVIGTAGDPVGSGFVKSLARPGGNITGLSELAPDIGPKFLEMLISMVNKLSRVAVLMNSSNSSHAAFVQNVQSAAQRGGMTIFPFDAQTLRQLESGFSAMTKERVGACIVAIDAVFNQYVREIAELAVKHRLPSIAAIRQFAEAGCLLSYGPSIADNYMRAATYVDRILKGAKPADLPVQQPTRFELVINRKTANALRLTIPQSLLISADKVIE
jgi:ABC-type uncharacterized transport system substrate-binding protein